LLSYIFGDLGIKQAKIWKFS